jgi:hypothetical protein
MHARKDENFGSLGLDLFDQINVLLSFCWVSGSFAADIQQTCHD